MLPNLNSPDIMALNFVTDIVFSNRRKGTINGNDRGAGRIFKTDMIPGTYITTQAGNVASGRNMLRGRMMQKRVNE